MKGPARFLGMVVTVGMLAGPLSAAEDQPRVNATDVGTMEALIKQLGADEFTSREVAQKRLETIAPGQLEALQTYADRAKDPETRARLESVIDTIQEAVATTPPPISVDLKKATYADVAAALSKATHTGISGSSATQGLAEAFNLTAVDQPFWEVMRSLSAQHNAWIVAEPFLIGPFNPGKVSINRGVAVSVTNVISPAGGDVQIPVTVALDPRINVVDFRGIELEDARDNAGHLFTADSVNDAAARRRPTTAASHLQNREITLKGKDPIGSALSIRGNVAFTVMIAEKTTEIANAEKHLHEEIQLGDSRIKIHVLGKSPPAAAGVAPPGGAPGANAGVLTIRGGMTVAIGGGNAEIRIGGAAANAGPRATAQVQIIPNDARGDAPPLPDVEISGTGGITIKGSLTSTAGARILIDNEGASGGMSIGTTPTSTEATHIVITDATGKVVANYFVPRGAPVTSIHGIAGDFQPPLKVKVSVPIKIREVSIPFEFKNLPVK